MSSCFLGRLVASLRLSLSKGCLVREMKIFGDHIGCFGDVRKGFWILIKKIHSSSGNCETNLLRLINPSLAHVSTVALMANHRLISLKTFVSRFPTKLCN